jgi:hypothetical protein
MQPFSFVYEQPDDPKKSLEAQTLLRYKNSLENMRNVFLFQMNLRTITQLNIDAFERELRDIVKGLEMLRHIPHTGELLASVDAVQTHIWAAIKNLYLASDLLEGRHTPKGRELLYQKFGELPGILYNAIENFKI